MRLRKSRNAAEEEIIRLLNSGYQILNWLKADYSQQRQTAKFDSTADHQKHADVVNEWWRGVIDSLNSIFPTELESNQFMHPPSRLRVIAAETENDRKAGTLRARLDNLLKGLDHIRNNSLLKYTDLPVASRLYVEDIDSFAKVRDVNPDAVAHLLRQGNFLDVSEEAVQVALEKILNEPFHKRDWGGEYNDLYTSNVVVNGARRATAFLLKGNGLRVNNLEIKNCGRNGDQLIRLFESPADLFVVQYVGNVSEAVIKDVAGKVEQLKAAGKSVAFCIMNGLDTARLLHAYGQV
jgi:hypothetical protein